MRGYSGALLLAAARSRMADQLGFGCNGAVLSVFQGYHARYLLPSLFSVVPSAWGVGVGGVACQHTPAPSPTPAFAE